MAEDHEIHSFTHSTSLHLFTHSFHSQRPKLKPVAEGQKCFILPNPLQHPKANARVANARVANARVANARVAKARVTKGRVANARVANSRVAKEGDR
jgi:hypothetical protein